MNLHRSEENVGRYEERCEREKRERERGCQVVVVVDESAMCIGSSYGSNTCDAGLRMLGIGVGFADVWLTEKAKRARHRRCIVARPRMKRVKAMGRTSSVRSECDFSIICFSPVHL